MASFARVKKPMSKANPNKRTRKRRAKRNGKKMSAAAKSALVKRLQAGRKKAARKNPRRKANPMARAKAKNPSKKRRSRTKRSRNPFTARRRRRNPTIVGRAGGFAMDAATALVTLVATRQIPQMVLGDKNSGLLGYAANLITTLAVAYGSFEFLSQRAANAALIGGGVYLVNRILTEKVSPIGQYLQLTGLGDAQAASNLGAIVDGYFVHPTVLNAQGQPVIPQQILDASAAAARAALPASPASAPMSGIPNRFGAPRRGR